MEKTINLGGYPQIQQAFDRIYLLIANGEKFATMNSLIARLRKDKCKIDGEALRTARNLGYLRMRPYIQWLQVGPLTEHHIKILMYETFVARSKHHYTYRDVTQAFFALNVPNCKYREADKEALRLKRIVAGLSESSVHENSDFIKETVQAPLIASTMPIVSMPEIEVQVSKAGISISVPSKGLYLSLDGKVTLKLDM